MQLQRAVGEANSGAIDNRINLEKSKALLDNAGAQADLVQLGNQSELAQSGIQRNKLGMEAGRFELDNAKEKQALSKEYASLNDENDQGGKRREQILKLLGQTAPAKWKTEVIKGGIDPTTGAMLPDRVVQYDDKGNLRFASDDSQPQLPNVKNGDVKMINGRPMKYDENQGWVNP